MCLQAHHGDSDKCPRISKELHSAASDKSLKDNSGLNKLRGYFPTRKWSPRVYRTRLEGDAHHVIKLLFSFYTVILSIWRLSSMLPHGQKMIDRAPDAISMYLAEKKGGKVGGQRVCISADSIELIYFRGCWCCFCAPSQIVSCTTGGTCYTLGPQVHGCTIVTLKSVFSERLLFPLVHCPSFAQGHPHSVQLLSYDIPYWRPRSAAEGNFDIGRKSF